MGLHTRHLLCLAAGSLKIELYMNYLSTLVQYTNLPSMKDTAWMNNSPGESQADDKGGKRGEETGKGEKGEERNRKG